MAVLLMQVLSATPSAALGGPWKAALDLAGGALPFEIRISGNRKALTGRLCNGDWCQAFSAVRLERDTLVLEMIWPSTPCRPFRNWKTRGLAPRS